MGFQILFQEHPLINKKGPILECMIAIITISDFSIQPGNYDCFVIWGLKKNKEAIIIMHLG
jgi:hypothetical protein